MPLVHDALLFEGMDAFAASAAAFLAEGIAEGAPVMAAVPGRHGTLLREALGSDARAVRIADMSELGRNPARIIPALLGWLQEYPADNGRAHARFVGEPIWPGRTACEIAEATRHEALLNLAFAEAPISILCPYDVRGLDEETIAGAACTHPHLVRDGVRSASPAYAPPHAVLDAGVWPLTDIPGDAFTRTISTDLGRLRREVRERIGDRLSGARLEDFLVAVNEAACNALEHGRPPAVLRLWAEPGEVVCEVDDGGCITDPLAGRGHPHPRDERGRGLWLINELCDLSQLRSGPQGTTVRVHMACGRPAAVRAT